MALWLCNDHDASSAHTSVFQTVNHSYL